MRIHGDVRITRRGTVDPENDYKKYREPLAEDFKNICGYCGKHINVSRRGFEIDHFVPITTDATRETDYTNLVFSCFTCNRKKSKKWPTQDKNLCHNGQCGFVDPTTEEYDSHLGRNLNGLIEHYSDVGKYMYNVFKFELRPTDKVWKTMELIKYKKRLREIKETISLDEYIEIDKAIDDLLEYLLGKGE